MNWRILLIIPLLLILTAVIGYTWYLKQISPLQISAQSQNFIVKKGQSIDGIGQALAAANLIRSPLIFKLVVYQKDLTKKIQAGTFKLSPSMTTSEIAQNLTKGTQDLWVTILEGWRREETAAALTETFTAVGLKFDSKLFLDATKNQEGYLFPETYLVPQSASENFMASLLKKTFDQKVTDGLKNEIDQSGKKLPQIMIMASLIEREARSSEARAMVSGILWKRLEAGWPLQVDATLQYAKGYNLQAKSWWESPLGVDKELNSPYNTYKNPGLPPAPICSPSLSSIKAAISPISSEYWYYLTGNDNQMHYAADLAGHNQNIAKYLK
jgi:UPF0755 protein